MRYCFPISTCSFAGYCKDASSLKIFLNFLKSVTFGLGKEQNDHKNGGEQLEMMANVHHAPSLLIGGLE